MASWDPSLTGPTSTGLAVLGSPSSNLPQPSCSGEQRVKHKETAFVRSGAYFCFPVSYHSKKKQRSHQKPYCQGREAWFTCWQGGRGGRSRSRGLGGHCCPGTLPLPGWAELSKDWISLVISQTIKHILLVD